jgi:hypothetical protein
MASSINFDNGGERFNIHLDAQGNLNFNANGTDGNGSTRVSMSDDTGTLTIGGSGTFGALQLKNSSDGNTIFIGASGTEATALLGGGANDPLNGIVRLGNTQGLTTIELQGSTGNCRCVSHTETSDLRLKTSIAPLLDALAKVLAMRGVRYQRKEENSPSKTLTEETEIGFIGQEVESICPEIVSTDSRGYKSLKYTRLTALLVEAIKGQQQLIQQQASALGEALNRIAQLETNIKV